MRVCVFTCYKFLYFLSNLCVHVLRRGYDGMTRLVLHNLKYLLAPINVSSSRGGFGWQNHSFPWSILSRTHWSWKSLRWSDHQLGGLLLGGFWLWIVEAKKMQKGFYLTYLNLKWGKMFWFTKALGDLAGIWLFAVMGWWDLWSTPI